MGSRLTENASSEVAFFRLFLAVISTSEKGTITATLSPVPTLHMLGCRAGYKNLCVVQGFVDIYIFLGQTTFKWDSCATHAGIRAMAGGQQT